MRDYTEPQDDREDYLFELTYVIDGRHSCKNKGVPADSKEEAWKKLLDALSMDLVLPFEMRLIRTGETRKPFA